MSSCIKFVSDLFFTSEMIKKHFTALSIDENILYFTENSDNTVFNWNRMGILNIDLDNIDLGDTNYEEDDLDTIILIRLLACHIKFEKGKELKKIKINKKNKWRINVSS